MKATLAAFLLALLVALLLRREENPSSGNEPGEGSPPPIPATVVEQSAETCSATFTAPTEPQEPHLLARSSAGCTPESGYNASLKWLVRHQNADGSWGEGAEFFEGHLHTPATATSLALLSILGAGHSHLSKEDVDGKRVGDAVKAGLKWLAARAPADAFEAALGSLAMSEAYGLTNSRLIGTLAGAALAHFESFQRFGGSWGDAETEAWSAAATVSAKLSGLETDEAFAECTVARLRVSLDAAPAAETAAVYMLLAKDKLHPALPSIAAALAASPPSWERPEFTRWYFGTSALFQLEGPTGSTAAGESWRTWSEALKETLVRNRQRDGSWPGLAGPTGSAVRTALGSLSLEVYYRYENVFGAK